MREIMQKRKWTADGKYKRRQRERERAGVLVVGFTDSDVSKREKRVPEVLHESHV